MNKNLGDVMMTLSLGYVLKKLELVVKQEHAWCELQDLKYTLYYRSQSDLE